MKKIIPLITFIIFFILNIEVFAKNNDKQKSKKDNKIRFDEIEISGENRNPVNAFLIIKNKTHLPKLIILRKNFKDELNDSVQDL